MNDKERLEQTNARYLERITKLENEVRKLTCEKRINDDYIEMLEDDRQTINNHKVFHMQKNSELEKQNKHYREALINLREHIEKRWKQGYALEATLYIDQALEESE